MSIIDREKHTMLAEHAGYILNKPADHRTEAEKQWLPWAEKLLLELEGAK